MKILSQVAVLACLLVFLGTVRSADEPSFDLLKTMSAADFRATGLDHLSDTQLQALNAWIAGYEQRQAALRCAPAQAGTAPAAQATAPAGGTDTVVAHLVGSFTGWSNGKKFTLDNGEVWEQLDDTAVSHSAIQNPKVTISSGAFNAHYLSVEGVFDSVLVRKVKP
jgi:hypothetical protein